MLYNCVMGGSEETLGTSAKVFVAAIGMERCATVSSSLSYSGEATRD